VFTELLLIEIFLYKLRCKDVGTLYVLRSSLKTRFKDFVDRKDRTIFHPFTTLFTFIDWPHNFFEPLSRCIFCLPLSFDYLQSRRKSFGHIDMSFSTGV